jgi:hypothetical protein
MYTSSGQLSMDPKDMKATVLDLRKRSKDIVKALDRNQSVTLFYRGKAKGVIVPTSSPPEKTVSAGSHRAFRMWRNRVEMKSVCGVVAKLRKARHAL